MKKMEKVKWTLMMDQHIMEILKMIWLTDLENKFGMMVETMKECGNKIKWTDKVNLDGLMVELILESTKMIRKMVKVLLLILMVLSMKVLG